MKKIYISGGFYGQYKETLRQCFGRTTCFVLEDPEQEPTIPGEYVGRDFDLISSSDLVIAVQSDYPYLYGMAAEIGYAVAKGIPVIYVCLSKRVDCFLAGCSRAIFTDVVSACEFIIARYSD